MPSVITSGDPDLRSFFGGKKEFNDPFVMNSNMYIPKDFYTALEFCLFLAIQNPTYTQATRRTVSHFITDFEFIGKSGDTQEQNALKDYLTNTIKLLDILQQAGMEQMIYGNSFMWTYFPFNRYIVDERDGRYKEIAVEAFGRDIRFNLADLTYNVPDPKTLHLPSDRQSRVDLPFRDRKSYDKNRIRVRLLNPLRMMINMNLISGQCEYIYRFEEFFKAAVRNGTHMHQINDTPKDMLEAIRDNCFFAFSPGNIFHFKNPFVSGLSYSGWGIPNILLNYNNIHQVQVLRCINEAIGLDYLVPFRLLSPTPQAAGGGDAAMATNLGRWQSAMKNLIAHKRQDPTALHTVPFPVSYQELGANGKALAPVELMKFQQDELLDGMGYPAELWHMSLQTQQIPAAIRLFESTFIHLQRNFNNATKWVTKNILSYLSMDQVGIKLMLPSVADDMEKRHVWLQLAAGGEVSRATAYRAFNIDDPIQEMIRRAKEDIEIEKARQKEEENFQREMTLGSANQVVDAMLQSQGGPGGGMDGGGAPAGPGGAAPAPQSDAGGMTPLDIEQQGEQKAMELLQIQDNGERSKAMKQLEASNPTLYAVTKTHMEKIRQQGASQGRKSVGQPQQ